MTNDDNLDVEATDNIRAETPDIDEYEQREQFEQHAAEILEEIRSDIVEGTPDDEDVEIVGVSVQVVAVSEDREFGTAGTSIARAFDPTIPFSLAPEVLDAHESALDESSFRSDRAGGNEAPPGLGDLLGL